MNGDYPQENCKIHFTAPFGATGSSDIETGRPPRSNDQPAGGDPDKDGDNFYPTDTFSFLLPRYPKTHLSSLYSLAVLAIQVTTLGFLLADSIDRSGSSNPLSLPPNVSLSVRACQILALFISVMTQDNVRDSVDLWCRGLALEEEKIKALEEEKIKALGGEKIKALWGERIKALEVEKIKALMSRHLWHPSTMLHFLLKKMITSHNRLVHGKPEEELPKEVVTSHVRWYASSMLRFLEGLLGLVATFILIIRTETASDVLLNFTAVEFVSTLDNTIFELAKWGYMGGGVQGDAKKIDNVKRSENDTPSTTLRMGSIPLVFLVMFGMWFWISGWQASGHYLCETVFVQFGDEISPGMAHFSGLYQRKLSSGWSTRAEYLEVGPSPRSNNEQKYEPARFGYCEHEHSWVWAHGSSAERSPRLCNDWKARSVSTDSYDILSTASSTWRAKKDMLQLPLETFQLSCYDCNNDEDFCGGQGRGRCVNNRCECEEGWYGLRCEFASPCKTLVVDVNSHPFPADDSSSSENGAWPKEFRLWNGVNVYNRPVFFGNYSFANNKNGSDKDYYHVVLHFSGHHWTATSFKLDDEDQTIDKTAGVLKLDYHGFWSKAGTVRFASEPMDIDTSTDAVAPIGKEWFDSRGEYMSPLEHSTILVCRGIFSDYGMETVVKNWVNDSTIVQKKHGDINEWDTSRVTIMSRLFQDAEAFNENIASWDTSSVVDMSRMFRDAFTFNQSLPWVTSSVRDMSRMFFRAKEFNGDISSWDVSNVSDLSRMFRKASSFNQNISLWNVSNADTLQNTFKGAEAFNQDISSWDVSKVRFSEQMFRGASSFNQNISSWNVSSMEKMARMFQNAVAFNQDLSRWNVSAAKTAHDMFLGAESFNHSLCAWGPVLAANNASVVGMFSGTACPEKGDPDLTAKPPGPFCHPCKG